MQKAVIFDLYGTLADIQIDEESEEFWRRLGEDFAARFDFDPSPPDVMRHSYNELIRWAKESGSDRVFVDALLGLFLLFGHRMPDSSQFEEAVCVFRAISTIRLIEFPYSRELVQRLKFENVKVGLLSNTEAELTECDLEKVLIGVEFDALHLSSRGHSKPDKKAFASICHELGVSASNAVMVGDTWETDVLGAIAVGMQCIYLGTNPVPENLRDRISVVNTDSGEKLYNAIMSKICS